MKPRDKKIALDAIRMCVWSGFYDADEIVEFVDETVLEPGQADPGWLRGEIDAAFAHKRAEEKTWPAVTDCDRLDRMFDALNRDRIVALQKAGYTQDDGYADVSQVYHEAGGDESGLRGYCFYHEQDLERVMESGELWLAFGDTGGDDKKGAEIGRRIQRAAEAAGFKVKWDGSAKTRILLIGIKWQRRSA